MAATLPRGGCAGKWKKDLDFNLTQGQRLVYWEEMKNPQNASRPASAISSEAASREAKIGELELEIKRLRRLGRTKREPVAGIGGTIQRLREQKAIGLRELATACDMSAGNISRIEQEPNANPTLELLEKFARGLKVTLSELIERYEQEKPQIEPSSATAHAGARVHSGAGGEREEKP